jgi:hypothetical protein
VSNRPEKTFACNFIDVDSRIALELRNATDRQLKSIEILTIFLRDNETVGAPSQSHIRFEPLPSLRPHETVVLQHQTWSNGKPASNAEDELGRLRVIAGTAAPYVLDISWQDVDGKSGFQRIPVGH